MPTARRQKPCAQACRQPRQHDTTGQWALVELPVLLGALDCFVGVDSGATYMADALGVPVVDGPADADDQQRSVAR